MARSTLGIAALVAVGCYLGAKAGVLMTFPGAGAAAVCFVPYAVLYTALVSSPPKLWSIYLLASSLGNVLAHAGSGVAPSFALEAEIANGVRGLVAAAGTRRFGRGGGLNDLRGMATFMLFCVGIGPLVGGALGAVFVIHSQAATDFRVAWQEWTLSNSLTALIFCPLLLGVVDAFSSSRRQPSPPGRRAEALALAVGLLAAGAVAFDLPTIDVEALAARSYWLLPVLLWVAVRFTPVVTSAALLGVTSMTVWGALHGRGPFTAARPIENVLNAQLFIIALSLPLLLVSSVVQEGERTTRELRKREKEYTSVVDDQTEMICRFFPDQTYTFVNAAYAAWFGLPREAFAGKRVGAVAGDLHAGTMARLLAVTADAPLATQQVQTSDLRGHPRLLEWRDRGFFDPRGKVLEYQCVGRDVTDARLAEEERLQLDAQKQIALTLQEADRRKDDFLAMLGHELGNPLAPIGLAVELLRRGAPPRSATRALDTIARQLGHMTRLVDDLLDVSRITRGTVELRLEPMDLRGVVLHGVDTARPHVDARRHEVIVDLPDGPLIINGDGVRLGQIVGNLVHNAARYTEPGGHVHVSARRDGAQILLSVEDDGVGIPSAMLDRVFDLFVQGPNRADTMRGGLGIGLSLVRQIAVLHGGSVEASSEGIGRGTKVVVTLPALSEPTDVSVGGATATDEGSDPPLKVLVVDDNIDAADTLAALLDLWGHTAHRVHDGAAALEAVESLDPNVILLDLDLPRVGGLEVATRVRRTHDASRLTLVALTGFGQPDDRMRTAAAGFDHHLVKPVDIHLLRTVLRASHPSRAGNERNP